MALRRLSTIWLIFAMLFSNIATAAMWCCQAGNHHQPAPEQHQLAEPNPHQLHHEHQHQAADSHATADQNIAAAEQNQAMDHGSDCPHCAASCHSALVLPFSDVSNLEPHSDNAIKADEPGFLAYFPRTPHRPPIV